jgi:molecular chaperone HscB
VHSPKNFTLEQRKIEQTYWNLQKRLHPDLYGSKSEFEKELSAVNAAVINDAYNMLKTPNTRVKYLVTALAQNNSVYFFIAAY